MSDQPSIDRESLLNDFWNSVTQSRDDSAQQFAPLDPGTTETIQRLHALAATQPPASSRTHVRQALGEIHRLQEVVPGSGVAGSTGDTRPVPFSTNGVHQPGDSKVQTALRRSNPNSRRLANRSLTRHLDPLIRPRRWLGGFAPSLASFALVMITISLALAQMAVWPFDRSEPSERPVIYAPVEATPVPEDDATLMDVIIPSELLPSGEKRVISLGHVQIEPDAIGEWYPTCCDGPMIEYILSGSLTVTSSESVQVLRADGALIEIASDTEIVLRQGDALITRNRISFTYANSGRSAVSMLEWLYLEDPTRYFAGHPLPGWGGPGGLDVTYNMPLFTTQVHVTLSRFVLDPGEAVSMSRTDGIRLSVTPNLETDVLRRYGDETIQAVDSAGGSTTAFTIDIVSIATASELPVVGLPPP